MPIYKLKIQSLKFLYTFIIINITAFSYAKVVNAESVYVSDNLRVGVRPKPDDSIAPINVVTSGMHLTVIESEAGYIKIRTTTGITGWVKEVYMTNDIPVREKFDSLNIKYGQQSATIEDLKKTIDSLTKIKVALITDLGKERTEKSDIKLELAQVLEEKYVENLSNSRSSLIIIAIAIFVVAFIIGMLWHRFLVTRRLGGLRL